MFLYYLYTIIEFISILYELLFYISSFHFKFSHFKLILSFLSFSLAFIFYIYV